MPHSASGECLRHQRSREINRTTTTNVDHWITEQRRQENASKLMMDSDTKEQGAPTNIVSTEARSTTLRGLQGFNKVDHSGPSGADQSGQRSASSSATTHGERTTTDHTYASQACPGAARIGSGMDWSSPDEEGHPSGSFTVTSNHPPHRFITCPGQIFLQREC